MPQKLGTGIGDLLTQAESREIMIGAVNGLEDDRQTALFCILTIILFRRRGVRVLTAVQEKRRDFARQMTQILPRRVLGVLSSFLRRRLDGTARNVA